ncbi:MAG: hypothetical protein HKP51_04600 [Sulfitobacter sp.]|nr:hypothetical protein [Sulfitobacter sp.]
MTLKAFRFWVALICTCLGASVEAQQGEQIEVPRGLWETEPDALGVVLHVRTRRCGRALCGRVERAKNRRGYDTPSNAVGDKVLWEMRPQPDGSFYGEYRGPLANRYLKSRVQVFGREMVLQACDDESCRKLVWTRIR